MITFKSLEDLVEVCRKFDAMGWSVQGQMCDVLDNSDNITETNGNAAKHIIRFIEDVKEANVDDDEDLDFWANMFARATGDNDPDLDN